MINAEMDPNSRRVTPEAVRRAQRVAVEHGFVNSCLDSVGWLLATLASSASLPILEIGTGVGVGTSWLATANLAPVITVEQDPYRADIARRVLSSAADVEVVTGTFDDVRERGPFGFVFIDVAEQKDDGQPVVDIVSAGGVILLDDFTPEWLKDVSWHGVRDERRSFWLHHPLLTSTEILPTSRTSAIIATKRRAQEGLKNPG